MASVDFERVEKTYEGGNVAVAGVSLHVDDGELVVFVGPSGCGKSTLLRLLAGLETVTRGTIRIGGRAVNDASPQERNVAMVFQDYALYPHMTVRGNLEFPLRMRRLAKDEVRRRVEWAAELLDLAGRLDRLPKQLSGGERQRVAMGRALVREPAVFLLDEPLSNLDAKLRAEVRGEIGELQKRTRTTMIYVTHDQVEAMTLGHRVVVLDRGRVQQAGGPREVYDHPANAFVAGFIGNPPMNLFPASVSADGAVLAVGAQSLRAPAERLRPLAGRRLTAGVRAEALRLAGAETAAETLRAVVLHTESLGHETLATVAVDGGIRMIVRIPEMPELAKGASLSLAVDPEALHFFGEDGRALEGDVSGERHHP